SAYHSAATLRILGDWTFPYLVIPTQCAKTKTDWLSVLLSHELVEAATDPIPGSGWIDTSLSDANGGEAADICAKAVVTSGFSTPVINTYLDNGLGVTQYWSNADNACAPLTHTLTL